MRARRARLREWLQSVSTAVYGAFREFYPRPRFELPHQDPDGLRAIIACALISVAKFQPLPVATESYRLAANYGSSDALGFYGAAIFQAAMVEKIAGGADWQQGIFDGLNLMDRATRIGAPSVVPLLDGALAVMPAALLDDWKVHSSGGVPIQ